MSANYACHRCGHEADPAVITEPLKPGGRILCEECNAYEAGARSEREAIVLWVRSYLAPYTSPGRSPRRSFLSYERWVLDSIAGLADAIESGEHRREKKR